MHCESQLSVWVLTRMAGITGMYCEAQLSVWVLHTQPHVLVLVYQVLYPLSHLLRPCFKKS